MMLVTRLDQAMLMNLGRITASIRPIPVEDILEAQNSLFGLLACHDSYQQVFRFIGVLLGWGVILRYSIAPFFLALYGANLT
jgi:hypothetical protein